MASARVELRRKARFVNVGVKLSCAAFAAMLMSLQLAKLNYQELLETRVLESAGVRHQIKQVCAQSEGYVDVLLMRSVPGVNLRP